MAIGIALVGSGIYSRKAYLPAIVAQPNLSLLAIYSRTWGSASSLHALLPLNLQSSVKIYTDNNSSGSFRDILAKSEIQGLIIALPIAIQPDFISAALAAGKHILSEKPMAQNISIARDLLQEYTIAQQQNKSQIWHVAENWRLLHAVTYAAQLVQGLGRVLGFRTQQCLMMNAESPFLASGWRADPALKGGLLLDGAVHGIAVLRILLGKEHQIQRLSAFAHTLQPHLPPPDTLDAVVKTVTGITGVMQISYGTTFTGPVFEVACVGGVVYVDGFDTVIVRRNGCEPERWMGGGLGESVSMVLNAWMGAVESGREEEEERLTAKNAFMDLKVLQSMLKSAESEGSPVDLDEII